MRMNWAIGVLPAILLLAGEGDASPKGGEAVQAETGSDGKPPACEPASRSVQNVLDALDQRERAVARREAAVEAREADLRILEQTLTGRMGDLTRIRGELKGELEKLDTTRQTRVSDMVKVFNAMRPNEAAPILSAVEKDLAVEVLSRMGKAKAAKVLGAMDPQVAAGLSASIARAPKIEAASVSAQ